MANGPALLSPDDKISSETKADDNVDIGGGFGSGRLYRR
jgi:hypothetical protein